MADARSLVAAASGRRTSRPSGESADTGVIRVVSVVSSWRARDVGVDAPVVMLRASLASGEPPGVSTTTSGFSTLGIGGATAGRGVLELETRVTPGGGGSLPDFSTSRPLKNHTKPPAASASAVSPRVVAGETLRAGASESKRVSPVVRMHVEHRARPASFG
jgi:hypothetical protein